MIARAAGALRRFFFTDVDPFVLGIYRAALGGYLILFYVMLAPSWLLYYGPGGITPVVASGGGGSLLLSPLFWHVQSRAVMWALYGVSLGCAVLLAIGAWWRIALVWLWYMNLTLLFSNPYVVNGEEQVMGVLLLFSLFLPLGASFTWRQLARADGRRAMLTASARVPVWSLRALQLQLLLVYLASVPAKLSDPAWRDGTLVYYAMMATDYPRWPGLEIFAWGNAALSRILTGYSLAVEMLVPFLIWFRRLRLPCVAAALALHAGMAVLIEGVMMFNLAMMVGLILFLPGQRTRLWMARRLAVVSGPPATAESRSRRPRRPRSSGCGRG
ncbi:MAG TPA: HTTM domain-containing protein [Kofleriaceae bacterium]|nr:HTTM domain-containing protein [Kofleriaceae bacterium]